LLFRYNQRGIANKLAGIGCFALLRTARQQAFPSTS
jgi:hypothetical protein